MSKSYLDCIDAALNKVRNKNIKAAETSNGRESKRLKLYNSVVEKQNKLREEANNLPMTDSQKDIYVANKLYQSLDSDAEIALFQDMITYNVLVDVAEKFANMDETLLPETSIFYSLNNRRKLVGDVMGMFSENYLGKDSSVVTLTDFYTHQLLGGSDNIEKFLSLTSVNMKKAMSSSEEGSFINKALIGRNDSLTKDVVRFMFGGTAKEGLPSDEFARTVANELSSRYDMANALLVRNGANVKYRKDYGLKSSHDPILVRSDKEGWKRTVLASIKFERSFNKEGVAFKELSTKEIDDVLNGIYESIISDKTLGLYTPDMPTGKGTQFHPRLLQFKDGDSFINYHEKFGKGSLRDVVVEGLKNSAKEIAIYEKFSPRPSTVRSLMMNVVAERAYKAAKEGKLSRKVPKSELRANEIASNFIEKERATQQSYWEYVTGESAYVKDRRVSGMLSWLRAGMTLTKMGTVLPIAVPSDAGTSHIGSKRLGELGMGSVKRIGLYSDAIVNPTESSQVMANLGLINDSLVESVTSTYRRLVRDNTGVAGSLGGLMYRISGVTLHTEAAEISNLISLGMSIFEFKDTAFGELSDVTKRALHIAGIGESDWDIIRNSNVQSYKGDGRVIVPSSVEDEAVAKKLHRLFKQNADTGVLKPDTQSAVLFATKDGRGSMADVLKSSIGMFSSFPISYFNNVIMAQSVYKAQSNAFERILSLGYIGSVMTGAGLVGMLAKDTLNGWNVASSSYWFNPDGTPRTNLFTRALIQGGALPWIDSILLSSDGGILFQNYQESTHSLTRLTQGALMSEGIKVTSSIQATMKHLINGDFDKASATMFKTVKGLTPFQNLWYTKGLTNAIIFDSISRVLDPDYDYKIEQRNRLLGFDGVDRLWDGR